MRFQKTPEEEYSINLPSMTDIIFLLLIFFMVATVLKESTHRLDVQLPDARSSEVAESRRFTVVMASDGAITLNGESMTLGQLEARLTAEPGTKERRSVIIRADKRLLYGKVVEVMGVCQAVGIDDIAVAVK